MDKYEQQFYPETSFGGYTRFDGTVAFYTRVNALTNPDSVLVDFGCGRGQHQEDPLAFRRQLQCFKGKVASVIGLDVDCDSRNNPAIDEFRILTAGRPWPIDDQSVNLVLCDYVIEHLPDPDALFLEAQRVLIPNGYLCIRTTNLLSYVGLAARLIPNRWHWTVLASVQAERQEQDVFPTLYRCNTIRSLRRSFEKHHFKSVVYSHDAEPTYLAFSKITYALGVLHQRFAPGFLLTMIMGFGKLVR